MLVDSEILSLSTPEQFLEFSGAYLDSAVQLCAVLANPENTATYARGMVVLFLAYHGIELFLKGAIINKAPKRNIGVSHNIKDLYKQYLNLYPKEKYKFDFLFSETELSGLGLEADLIDELKLKIKEIEKKNPMDQQYRYPSNKAGEGWQGCQGIEPSSFLNELKELRRDLVRISQWLVEKKC